MFELVLVSLCVQAALLVPKHCLFPSGIPHVGACEPVCRSFAQRGGSYWAGCRDHWLDDDRTAARWLVQFARAAAVWWSSLEPGLRIPDIPLSLSVALLVSVALVGACLLRRWRAGFLAGALLAALVAVAVRWSAPPALGRLELSAVDVGQGDSLLVVLPNGKTLLVDGGGFPVFDRRLAARLDIGEDVARRSCGSAGCGGSTTSP